jgi:hypothetical protein
MLHVSPRVEQKANHQNLLKHRQLSQQVWIAAFLKAETSPDPNLLLSRTIITFNDGAKGAAPSTLKLLLDNSKCFTLVVNTLNPAPKT